MKKLKKSVKAIIISVVAVVVAVSAVLAVVLLRKDGGDNPPAPNNRYILTDAQLDLVNSINAQADKEQAESQKKLEVYDASRFVDENGVALDMQYVSNVTDESFVYRTDDSSELYFFGTNGNNITTPLSSYIDYPVAGRFRFNESVGSIYSYALEYYEGPNVVYDLLVVNIEDGEVDILGQKTVKLGEMQETYDAVEEAGFYLSKNCWMYAGAYIDGGVRYTDFEVYSYNGYNDNLLNIEGEFEDIGARKINSYSTFIEYQGVFNYVGKDGLFTFTQNPLLNYDYQIIETGLIIKEYDNLYQSVVYKFVDAETCTMRTIVLDDGFSYANFYSIGDKYFYMYQQTSVEEENEGKFVYFDNKLNRVIAYKGKTFDDKIYYSDGKHILLYNKIISTAASIDAFDHQILFTDDDIYYLDLNSRYSGEYFIVAGQGKNIVTLDGEFLLENDFIDICTSSDGLIGFGDDGKVYLIDIESKEVDEIVDFEETYSRQINNEKTLLDYGYYVTDDGSDISVKKFNGEVVSYGNVELSGISSIAFGTEKVAGWSLSIDGEPVYLTNYILQQAPVYSQSTYANNDATSYHDDDHYTNTPCTQVNYVSEFGTYNIDISHNTKFKLQTFNSSDDAEYITKNGYGDDDCLTECSYDVSVSSGSYYVRYTMSTIKSWVFSGVCGIVHTGRNTYVSSRSGSMTLTYDLCHKYVPKNTDYWDIDGEANYSSTEWDNYTGYDSAHTNSKCDIDNDSNNLKLKGATFLGWSAIYNGTQSSVLYSTASSYSAEKVYVFRNGNSFHSNQYSYACYQPDLYTIRLNLMGDLPTNTIKSSDIAIASANGFVRKEEGSSDPKTVYYSYENICYFIHRTGATDTSAYDYVDRKCQYPDGSIFPMTVQLPTPSVFGYTFQGWIPSDCGDRQTWVNTTFKTTSVTNIAGSSVSVIAPETTVYRLHYGNTKGTTQSIVQMTAVWKANDFTILFNYGSNDAADKFSAYVQNEVAVLKNNDTGTYYLQTIITDGVNSTTYVQGSGDSGTNITFQNITIKKNDGTNASIKGIKLGTSANIYPLFKADNGQVMADASAYATDGTKYYILRSYDINQNTSLFDINVNGTSLKTHTGDLSTNVTTTAATYNVTLNTTFDADALLSEIFGATKLINDDTKYLLNTNRVSITGSSSKFVGWAFKLKNGTTVAEILQPASISSYGGYDALFNYMKMVNDGNVPTVLNVEFYAVYSVKPYNISMDKKVDTEQSSSSFDSSYMKKEYEILSTINTNLVNADLINGGLVESDITHQGSTTAPEYLSTVTYTFNVGNPAATDYNDKVYYIFDKIELTNFGVKFRKGTASQSSKGYYYDNATVTLTNNGTTWGITAKKVAGDSVTSVGAAYTVHKESGYYYIGTYYTGNDANNKYNRIKIVSSSARSIQFTVEYLGISGDYFQGSPDEVMTHNANQGVFKINSTSAEGGYFGFTILPYVKSNFTKDDVIDVVNSDTTANDDTVLSMVSQTVYEKDSKLYFWINNVKYNFVNTDPDAGYYTLPNGGGAVSVNDTFGTFFRNSSSNNTIYYQKSDKLIYYPKQYVTESTPTKFQVGGVDTKTNYNSTFIYAIRPQQNLIYTTSNPTKSNLKKQDGYEGSAKIYELYTYLSGIEIAGVGTFVLGIDRVIDTKSGNYVYSDMRITDTSETSGTVFTEAYAANTLISYLGRTFKVHSSWYYTFGGNDTAYKNRALVMYLTTDQETGEFYYLMYTDIYSSETNEDATTGDYSITFTFSKFNKKLDLHLNDGTNTVDGVEVDTGDLFSTTDKAIVYRYLYANANTIKGGYYSEGLTRQTGVSTPTEQEFAGIDDSDDAAYRYANYDSWKINPSEFVILELQPTNGYLIKDLVIKVKGQVIVSLSLIKTLDNLSLTSEGYYTYTTVSGETTTNILYNDNGNVSKYFSRYSNSNNANYLNGVGYSRSVESNWTTNYSSVRMNPVWIMIGGVYDDVEIYASTSSYIEFNITDTTDNNLGYDGTAAGSIELDNLTKLSLVSEVEVAGSAPVKYEPVKLGTSEATQSTRVVKTGNTFRIIFLGKAVLFRKGIHIYASDEQYSSYFTNARLYMDARLDDGDIVSNPSAFERLNNSTNNVFFGRGEDGKSLYWTGNVENGYNDVLNSSKTALRSTPEFDGKIAYSSDCLTYFYISNIQAYFGMTTFSQIHDLTDSKFEYNNKFMIAMSIMKNTASVATNSYLYNSTLTNTEAKPTSGFEYSFNSLGYNSGLKQHYTDTTNNRKWLKNSGESAIECYQLDYVGLLGPAGSQVNYTKKSSWFNDTILTNIDKKYNVYDASSASYKSRAAGVNSQVGSGAYGDLTADIYGYGLSFTYYEIPGYYLQYIEVITADYGSIYIPISSVLDKCSGNPTKKGEFSFYSANNEPTSTVKTGLYYELDYVTTGDPRFEIRFYQDDADILAAYRSINLLSNGVTVNFYSYPHEYSVSLNAFANEDNGLTSSKNTISSESTFKGFSNNDTVGDTTQDYTSFSVTYDSLAVIDRYLTMKGYTFVGWGSKYYYEGSDPHSRYTGKVAGNVVNSWNSTSKWYDVRGLFASSKRSNLLNYFPATLTWDGVEDGRANYYFGMTSFNSYDFYVKSSSTDKNRSGYFITDTGYAGSGANQESYNFWSAYDKLFMANLGNYGEEPAYVIQLFAIWKPNTYSMKFNVNDSTMKNGSTESHLRVTDSTWGASTMFNSAFDTTDYLYFNIFDINETAVEQDEDYYTFITFDTSDWYVKQAKSTAGALEAWDLYNSYKAADTYQSFITTYADGYNDLKTIIDRYGYTWLGWFASKQDNEKQDDAEYDASTLVFGSKYYKMMATSDSGKNHYTYYGGGVVDAGMPMLNETLYDIFNTNGMVNEVYSQFMYFGQHKVNTSLGKSYVAHYNYRTVANTTTITGDENLTVTLYTNGDWLNSFAKTINKLDPGDATVGVAITYFDTTMTYSNYVYTHSEQKLEVLRTSNTEKHRLLYLTAYWEENHYKVVVDWQDTNTNDDGDSIYSRNPMGSSPAGILQSDGTTISKDDFGMAYFDDFEVSERLNKFSPVRVGYDFLGWTYDFNEAAGATNLPSLYYLDVAATEDIESYQTAYQNYLNNNILTTSIVLYVNGQCLQSGQFNTNRETLGDTELVDKNDNPHCVYIFALWKAQTFTINFDLNIEYEDLENLYEIDSNFALALYNSAPDENQNYETVGIRSDYYRFNNRYFNDIVANVNFTITFDQAFSTAYCMIGGTRFDLTDLFATSAGYYFLGWLYNANDAGTLLVANSLQSMISSTTNIAESHNTAGSVQLKNWDATNPGDAPVFNFKCHQEYLKVTNNKARTIYDNGTFEGGAKLKTSTNNNVLLSSVDKHGFSSNFGSVVIGGVECPIVSEVETINLETNYYLYFKYQGVKYYVRFYIEPNEGSGVTAFTSDESYLYFTSGGVKYKVRYEYDGATIVPYIVTSDYNNRTRFVGTNRIKMAVFGQKAHTNNITRNDLVENTSGYNYGFNLYIQDVTRNTDGTFEVKKGNQVSGTPSTLVFKPQISRQFTMYAHWEHKNDFEIVINNGSNESDVPTSNSNPGLSGFYHVENTYLEGHHNDGKDKSELVAPSSNITESDYGNDEGYDDPYLALTYNYYDDLNFNILPFYNGRYISEITLQFYSVTEVVKIFSQDAELMQSNYVYTTYTMVFKFKWNPVTHKIEIDQITFNNGISAEKVNCGRELEYNDTYDFTRIYQVTASGSAIKQLSIIDSASFDDYILKMFDYSTGATAGQVGVMNNNTVNATYGRRDVNKVAFNLTKVMSSIDITCKFSVQTYDLELYNFLDTNDEREFVHKEGVGDNNQYATTITLDEFTTIVDAGVNTEGRQPFKAGEVTNATNVVTISSDCSKDIVDSYRVPYGYYIYGVFYDSSYVGYRPVDDGYDGPSDLYNAQIIVNDPMFGFEWLYSNGYYTYGSTNVAVQAFEADKLYAQCSPVLGTKNKFVQAVRLEGLANYNFVGWYEAVKGTEYITFLQYDQLKESTYISRNITLYGYYKPINAPTSIEFYTWNDTNKNYVPYYGNKQEYTLNANLELSPFIQDTTTFEVSLKNDQNDFVDVDNYAKFNIYNNYGIDETAFNSKSNTSNIFDGNDFGQNNASDKSLLENVLQTYWFYYYAYDVLYFVKSSQTHIIRYDKNRDDAGQPPFYYYTNEGAKTGIVYGNVKTTDYDNFTFVDGSGATQELSVQLTVKENTFGMEYDIDGSYMYLSLPAKADAVSGSTPSTISRYYRFHEILDFSDYYDDLSAGEKTTWLSTAEPRYYVDIMGSRYYILPRNNNIAKTPVAKTIFNKNGKTTVADGVPADIVQNSAFVNIKNYFIEYYEEFYPVEYKGYTDRWGSAFINPFNETDEMKTTNTVTLPAVSDNPTSYYFDYEKAELYYNGAPSTVEHYVYCPVNTNYKSNVAYVSSAGSSAWETTGVTIKTLPSPHIGYWYDGGEKYGFVGYIQVTDKILENITKRGDAGDAGSGGEMYNAFLNYINQVYKFEDYDELADFKDQAALDAYLATYDSGGSGATPVRLARAFDAFIIALKEAVGAQVSTYTKLNFCANLLLADSYDYEDYAQKKISFINVNIPVSFKELLADPRDGEQIAISISFLYKFNIITQETVIHDNLYAIPVYSPFVMDYTESAVSKAGSELTIDAAKMDIWHFDIQNNATAHVYNVFSGDYVNYAVLTYEQYLTLRANNANVADYLTKMIKNEKIVNDKTYIQDLFTEDVDTRLRTIDFEPYSAGHYVVVAYYNKTGTFGDGAYVSRVGDNILHVTRGADGNVTYEITTMDKYY